MNAELKVWLNYGVNLDDLQDHRGIDPVVRHRVMVLARNGADPAWKILHHFDPIEELWRLELGNPEVATITTRSWMHDEENKMQFHSFVDVLEHPSTDSKVLRAVWNELRRGTRDGQIQDKSQIYAALLRLSPLLPESERLEIRSEFRQAKILFLFYSQYDRSFHGTYFEPHHPLMYLGGGLAIPWENDALSADLSWVSQYRRAVYPYPMETYRVPPNDIFSFIALGSARSYHSGAWGHRMESIPPLTPPFAPTAWQNARASHLRP